MHSEQRVAEMAPLIRTYRPVEVTVLFKCLGQLMTYTAFEDMTIKYKDAALTKYYD